jgi:hypothetical protein
MKDVVIDANVARFFDSPADGRLKALFVWLIARGSLSISRHLLTEYSRHGNRLLAVLNRDLDSQRRLNKIPNSKIKSFFDDTHYAYCCNPSDIPIARTVFLSHRKLLVSFDVNLRKDVNGFRKIDGIKPQAFKYPPPLVIE